MEQLRIANDTLEVVILPEVGARIHRLRVLGHDLLRTPDNVARHLSDPFCWGAFVMAPWCNRIEAGSVAVGSRRITLDPNFSDGSAIHGQVFARRWEPQGDRSLIVRAGGDEWPWEYEVGLNTDVVEGSLRIEQTLTNLAPDPMPAGIGLHPWFRRPLEVAIRGDLVHKANTVSLPQPEPVSGPFDLREIGEMSDDLDATWTRLDDPPVELRWPSLGVHATMRIAAPGAYVVAASPSRLDAIAVEPETHAPQGLRRMLNGEPGALMLLDPAQSINLRVEIAFKRFDIVIGGR
jgi:aldose 1-epimerase